ncbi:hypothetical protein B0H11DRAFT_1926267 [Mycena galericulata]|nr:hypothetical protein B0H11DRAFT_1926267 [Mycena galericulata]
MSPWFSLPVEVWLQILGLRICLRDLGALCLTSSQMLSITRPVLYRHLSLVAEIQLQSNVSVRETFALLARDAVLARSVRDLTLDSGSRQHTYYRNPGLLDIPSLRNMTQLKRVTIIGDLSRHAGSKDIVEFIQILHDLRLDELRFPAPGARAFILGLKRPQLEQLANPKRIECYMGVDNQGLLEQRLLTLLPAARPSLTSLSLTTSHRYSTLPLFKLHFPALRSLALDSTSDEALACPPGFCSFLSAHHATLEDLQLGYTSNNDTRAFAPAALILNEGNLLHSNFLPNLRVFRGHCRNVEMMARARMRCLTTLKELTIGSGLIGPEVTIVDLGRMFDAIEAVGRLNSLTKLDFDLFRWREPERDFIHAFVRRFNALCGPTLEVWRGLLPSFAPWPMDIFAAFPRLRFIRFPQDSMVLDAFPHQSLAGGYGLEVVRELAGACPMLEDVEIVASEGSQDVCWKIDRHLIFGIALKMTSCADEP